MRRAHVLLILGIGALAAAAVAWPRLLGDYGQFVIASIAFYSIGVLAVSTLAGLSGIWSMGHTAFMAIGAYFAATLAAANVPVEIAILGAVMLAGSTGFILGLSAGRFSTLYFGLLTLALCMAATEIIGHWRSVTGGDEGIQVSPARLLVGGPLSLKGAVLLCIALAVIAYLVTGVVVSGPIGRRWLAVKSQRSAAAAMGLKPHVENAKAFAFSAAIAALSGVGIAFAIAYLDPVAFNLDASVHLIVATVIGGTGSLLGALLGSIFIVAIPELARGVANVSVFVFGAATIAVLLFLRQGIAPSLLRFFAARRHRVAVAPAEAVTIESEAIARLVRQCLPPADRDLEIRDLDVSFGGVKALQGITLRLPAGATLGLIGPNGAGKTTLLNVISGFYTATSATAVRFGQTDLVAPPPYRRAAIGIGRTFQHAELFTELTIRETLMSAALLGAPRRRAAGLPERSAEAIAHEIMTGLGLAGHADAYPEALPFGVQKVADIGRALALSPSLVAMDEPFSGLDERERGAIRAILRGMRQAGVSILIIDHAVQEVLGIADRIVVLEFGRLLAEGTPAEIRGNPEVHRAYFGADGMPQLAGAST